jgi:hypothetical protein
MTRGHSYTKEEKNDQKGSTRTLTGGMEGSVTSQRKMVLQGKNSIIISSSPSKINLLETKILQKMVRNDPKRIFIFTI